MNEKIKNIVIDTNYTDIIKDGWFPNTNNNFSNSNMNNSNQNNWENKEKKKWFFDNLISNIIPKKEQHETTNTETNSDTWNAQETIQTQKGDRNNTGNTEQGNNTEKK